VTPAFSSRLFIIIIELNSTTLFMEKVNTGLVDLMRKKLVYFVFSIVMVLLLTGRAFAPEAQKAWLRMYASDSIYVGTDGDPWLADSYIVMRSPTTSSISLSIIIENIKGDSEVYQIVVPIVTNDTSAISSIEVNGTSLSPLDWATGGLEMTMNDGTSLGQLPPHGVYDDPTAYWVEYRSGQNLTTSGNLGDSLIVNITIGFNNVGPSNGKIHFDAYGWTDGEVPVIIDDTLDAAFAPFSKDITIRVPELPIGLIATISTGLCGYLLLKRKLTRT
jgi:hypothetical protein